MDFHAHGRPGGSWGIATTQSEANGTKQSLSSANKTREIATLLLVARNDINAKVNKSSKC